MQIKNIIPNTIKRLPILTKLAMMLVAAALIPLMFPNNGHGIHYDYAVGGIWRSNNLVAPYERIAKIQLIATEFEKTPKRSIKRYLYSN